MQARIAQALGVPAGASREEIEAAAPLIPIVTSGDRIQDRRLMEIGGKGLFPKEIEEALLDGRIDCAVHSLKDMPAELPPGLVLAATPEREDPRDAFISPVCERLEDLPKGARLGTASLRRQAQALHVRPDLEIVMLRGNVDTRIEKLQKGQVDAMILAAVGLKRLGRESIISSYIEPEAMLPAVGQGTVAIESRKDDHVVHALLEGINHLETRIVTAAERSLLGVLDGSCGTPIGSYAMFIEPGVMRLRGFFASPDGTEIFHADENAPVASVEDAYALGLRVGRSLREMIPQAVLLSCVS